MRAEHKSAYQRLLDRTLPRVIRSEAENEHYLELLARLDARSDGLTPAEKELANLLTLLIEDFEEQCYGLKPASPLEVLHELMPANDFKQAASPDGLQEVTPTHVFVACDQCKALGSCRGAD